MMRPSTAIIWFRRDLRVADNPALAAACASADRVVPVYVHAPDEDGDWAPGAASRWWLHHSLARLDERLRRLGAPLVIRRGPTQGALLALAQETGATQVFWNRRWEPAIAARDDSVAQGLGSAGLGVETSNASLFVEPPVARTAGGGPYRVFTPYWRACLPRLDEQPAPQPAPARLEGVAELQGLSLDELGLLPTIRWDAGLAEAWTPGEAGAQARLESFCERAIGDYADGRDRSDKHGVSRLSPHLHFGEIGPRQCLAAVRARTGARPADQRGADAFVRELGWREFAHHVLHHHPHTTTAPLDPRFRSFEWSPDERLLDAWRRGRTGYPLVDAGMRELWATGWMHNRARMVVASFLTKNLRQHWLEGARWFWDTLVDADLANNTLGWQWVAGCGADAAPYFRIFNPELQAGRHDPDGSYQRRWLAGTKPVPPVVDFRASRVAALAAYARLKR
ncbi:MAG: deoxyribodipyrimidine photo-lyase [Steroidobacteraceae bacterium]